eukprot:COSAG05_NODE_3601_length_1966_cov_10.289234_1_plen_403_part_00
MRMILRLVVELMIRREICVPCLGRVLRFVPLWQQIKSPIVPATNCTWLQATFKEYANPGSVVTILKETRRCDWRQCRCQVPVHKKCTEQECRVMDDDAGAMYAGSTRGQPTLDTWMGTSQWYADNCRVPDREQYAATDEARVRFAESRYKGSLLLTSAFERDVPVAIPFNPVNERAKGEHWMVLFIVPAEKGVYFFDSFGNSMPRAIQTALDTAFSKRGLGKDGWVVHMAGLSGRMQSDGYQCGIWALTVEHWFREWIHRPGGAQWPNFFSAKQREHGLVTQEDTYDANVIKTFIKGQRQAFKKRLLEAWKKAQEEDAARDRARTAPALSTHERAAQERSQKRRRAGAPRLILNPPPTSPPTSTTSLSIDLLQQHQHHQMAFDRLLAAEEQFREVHDLCEDD